MVNMPRAQENSRHMHLYGDAASARCMGGMLNMFDWNIATLRGKKLLADLDFPDGLEAPRNSLDIASSGVGGKDDTPKCSVGSGSSTKADIPYGFNKAAKPAIPAKELPKGHERRLGGPGVIARLMGLDALPDAPSAAERPTVLHVKSHKEKIPVARRLLKDVKALRTQSSDQSRFSSPESRAGKESVRSPPHRDDVNSDGVSRNDPAGRSREHPQEKQLQEFKRQFESRMAIQSGQETRPARQSDSSARQVQDKRVVVVEDGINEVGTERGRGEDGPRQLEAALKKFNKSTGVQEIIEVLQSNKDFCEALHSNKEFFLNYLQDPMPLDKHLLDPVPEENTYIPPPPIEVRKAKDASDSKRKVSEKKKKGGISPSAFARRFIDLRRESKSEPKEKSTISKSQSQTEENTPTSTPRASTSLLPRFRGRSRSRSAEHQKSAVTVSEDLVAGQNCFVNGFKADTHSPGNIVLLRPGSTESSGMSSPASVLSYSPSLSKSKKNMIWRGEVSAAEAGKGRQHELEEETTPRSERSRTSGWDRGSSGDDLPRNSREVARQRDAHDEFDSNGSRDRMAIARDIIREARASARESTKSQASIATGDGGHFAASKRTSRLGSESGDATGNSDGDVTPRSISRLSAASPSDYSIVVPSPGVSRPLSRPLVSLVNFSSSPRPSQDLAKAQALSDQGHQQQRDGDKQQDQRKTFPENYSNSSSRSGGSPRSRTAGTSSQVSSRVLRKAIAGSLIENWIIDSRNPHHDNAAISLPPLPEKEHVLRVASVATSAASQSEEESVCSSPKSVSSNLSLQRCRSVPNAALVRDSRSRGEQQPHSSIITDGRGPETGRAAQPSHDPSPPEPVASSGGRPFAESYKRGVEAVGSLFARAKSRERNKIFVRSRKKKDVPTADESRSIVPASPTPGQNLQSVSSCSSNAAGPVLPPEPVPAPATTDESNAFPVNHKEEHELAAKDRWDPEAKEVKRVSFSSDVRWASEREDANSEVSNVGSQSPAEMPSILSPCMQRVRVNADMATDQCLADAIITTDIMEVSAGPQSPRSPKVCSIATDNPQRKEDEQDTGGDKGGQPSPISVLDSPFEVDSPDPSPEELDEISSDLQDLRLRLRILKLDGNDRRRPNGRGSHDTEVQVVNRQLFARESEHCEESEGSQNGCVVPSSNISIPTVEADVESQRALLEGIDLEGFPCSRDCEEDLVYVRNLLVASEFVESSTKLFMRWHSPGQPLDPILFENLEDYYDRSGCAGHVVMVDGKEEGSERGPQVRTRHRVLFDAVNEVLLRKLGPYLNFRPWLHSGTPSLRPIPIGRVLVWDTWMELRDFFPSCGADASSFLLRRDLGRRREWDGFRENFQEVGLQLEKNIFEDLVDEAVQCLTYGRTKRMTV